MVDKETQDKKFEIIALLVILSVVFIFYLKTAIPNHIVFGDEGFHSRISQLMAENKEYPTFFGTDLDKTAFARPSLFQVTQAGFLSLFGLNEIVIKIFTPFIAVLLGLVVFVLTKKLYNSETGLLASILLVTLPSFITYSVLFYTDMLFVFYATLSILLFLLSAKENNMKYLILSAVFAGLAFLTKIVGIIFLAFIPIIFVYMLIKEKEIPKIKIFRKYFLFGLVFLIIISPFIFRNMYYYQAPLCDIRLRFFEDSKCSISTFSAQYQFPPRSGEGAGTESSLFRFGLINFVNFAYGEWSQDTNQFFVYKILSAFGYQFTKITGLSLTGLFFVFGIFGGIVTLAMKRDELSIILLVVLALLPIIIYQSSHRVEDTAREILLWAPIFSIIGAIYWSEIYRSLNKVYKYLGLFLLLFVLVVGLQSLTTKLSSIEQVKQFSPMFFQACDWVKTNLPEDSVLMTFWGYRAGYNCERNVSPGYADIRLSDNPQYIDSVAQQFGITHFFIQKFSISQDASRESYSVAFVQLLENNPQYFEKVYENGPSLQDCIKAGGCDGNIIYKVV